MRRKGRPSLQASRLVRFVLILFSLSFLVLSGRELLQTARFATLSVAAGLLEKDRPVSDKILAPVVRDAEAVRSAGICRTDLVAAATSVLLSDLDRNSADRDFEAWSTAVRRTGDHLRFAISCMPADSNSWLRYAVLQSMVAENPSEVAGLMHLSRILDPADAHMLFARLGFWNSFSDQTLVLAAEDVTSDLAVLLQWGDRCSLQPELAGANPALQSYIKKARARVPEDRLARFLLPCPKQAPVRGPFRIETLAPAGRPAPASPGS